MTNRRPSLGAAVADCAAVGRATEEYADILITLTLCVKLNGPFKNAVRACALALMVRVRESHSLYRLNRIVNASDPFVEFSAMRAEVNRINARIGLPADTFL